MKKIRIKRIALTNFKGLRNTSIDFDGMSAVASGANGSGKTTLFDAFTWVLFGKDSLWRSDFKIKTLDPNGIEITRIPHEVELTLLIDGAETRLRRSYKEKWVKRRGEVDERFEGHIQERFWNDVPCTEAEYNAKVAEICPADMFRMLTSTTYFTSLKPMAQREVLIRMAGGVTDNEVAAGNKEFESLIEMLTGKTIDELKKEISSKRNRIKAEADDIPAKIEENQRMMPVEVDYSDIKAEKAEKEKKIAEIDAQLADAAKLKSAADEQYQAKMKRLAQCKSQLYKLEQRYQSEANKQWQEQVAQRADQQSAISDNKAEMARISNRMADCRSRIEINDKDISHCMQYREQLIDERNRIRAEKIAASDNDFICPVCGHAYDAMERAEKLAKMQDALNKDKAERLAANTEKGKANNDRKLRAENDNAVLLDAIVGYEASIAALKEDIENRETWLAANPEPDKPNILSLMSQDGEYARIVAEIDALDEELLSDKPASENAAELIEAKKILSEAIEELNKELFNESIAAHIESRISELRNQHAELSAQMADLEKVEFAIAEFSRAKIRMVEEKINSMFSMVRFKMFDTQVNGAVVETCEATVNGVPYSSLNHAAQVNAGLDIIEAISKHCGIEAPIFIDNSESVNELLSTNAQQIRLAVSVSRQLQVNKINLSKPN